MSIIRIQKRTNPYVQIDKRPLEDVRLSWKAKGLLAYLLSKPDDWEVRVEDVLKRSPDGREAVRSAFRELKDMGYAILKKAVGGGSTWVIVEEPGVLRDGFPASQESGVSQTSGKSPTSNNKGTLTKKEGEYVLFLEGESKDTELDVFKLWNDTLSQTLPKVLSMSKDRKKKVTARLKNPDWRARWREAMAMIPASSFLLGKNARKWAANFDWFVSKDDVVFSILEGKYADRDARGQVVTTGAGKLKEPVLEPWQADLIEAMESVANGMEPTETNQKWWKRTWAEAVRRAGDNLAVYEFVGSRVTEAAQAVIEKLES